MDLKPSLRGHVTKMSAPCSRLQSPAWTTGSCQIKGWNRVPYDRHDESWFTMAYHHFPCWKTYDVQLKKQGVRWGFAPLGPVDWAGDWIASGHGTLRRFPTGVWDEDPREVARNVLFPSVSQKCGVQTSAGLEIQGLSVDCPTNPVIILPLRCLILSRVPGSRSRSRVARHAGDAGPTTRGTSHQCCDWLGNPPKTCWDMTTHWVQSCPIWLVVWTSFRFSRKRRWRSPSHTESYLYKSTREPLDSSESWGAKTQHISTSSQTKVATGALPRKWSRDLLPRFAHAAAQLRAYPGDLSGEWWLMWLGRVVGVEYGWVIICDYHPKHGAWFEPPQMGVELIYLKILRIFSQSLHQRVRDLPYTRKKRG